MSDAFAILVSLLVGVGLGYLLTRRVVGGQKWREGYLYGFNLAWDEKVRMDTEIRERQRKELRKRRPHFEIIHGDKK